MGVYIRKDSPFYWLLLERPNQKPLREATSIVHDGGSNRKITKANRDAAQQRYAQRMGELASRAYRLPGSLQRRPFKDHREWYAAHVSAHKRGKVRELSILNILGATFDAIDLLDIDREKVLEWRTTRLAAKVSPSTVTREEMLLRHLLSTAIPTYLDTNPLAGMKGLRIAKTDTRVLTPAEETRLLAALQTPEDTALVLVALDALLRMSNAKNLTRAQDHQSHLFSDTKTTAIRIPVSRRLRAALDALPPGDVFFPRYAGKDNTKLIDMFMAALRRADIQTGRKTGGVSFHTLRHTGATRMLSAGVDVKTVMEIGGWSNLKVLSRYLHPTDKQKVDAVNAIAGNHVTVTPDQKSA